MPEHVVHRVVVMEMLAGRVSREVPQFRVGLEHVAGAGQAGRVRQQVMRGDRRELRLDAQPRQVLDDRAVDVQLALVAQLQQRERDERLRDRPDLEQFVLRHRLPRLEVAETVGDDALHGVAVREHQRHAGRIHVAHVLLDEAVERGPGVRVAAVQPAASPPRSRGNAPMPTTEAPSAPACKMSLRVMFMGLNLTAKRLVFPTARRMAAAIGHAHLTIAVRRYRRPPAPRWCTHERDGNLDCDRVASRGGSRSAAATPPRRKSCARRRAPARRNPARARPGREHGRLRRTRGPRGRRHRPPRLAQRRDPGPAHATQPPDRRHREYALASRPHERQRPDQGGIPDAPVYATNAVDRVLAEGGFLARNLESSKAMLDDPKLCDTQKEEVRIFMATMAESDVLRPDVVVDAKRRTADRRTELRPARHRRRRHRRRHLALRRHERRRGHRRSRDLPGALLRDGLPARLAQGAR